MLPYPMYGKHGRKASCLISGGLPNHGKHIPSQWILKKAAPGYILWKVLTDHDIIAAPIMKPLFLMSLIPVLMLFATKKETSIPNFPECIGKLYSAPPGQEQKWK